MNIINIIHRIANLFRWSKPVEIDYTKRAEEMRRMRFEEGLSTSEIARRFNRSRERVRQIIGNTGKDFRKNWTKNLIASGQVKIEDRDEIKSAPGIQREWIKDWGNRRHKIKSGEAQLKAEKFQERANKILSENGIPNILMPFRFPYRISGAGGTRIQVVVSNVDVRNMKSQNKCVYPMYSVPVRNRSHWDFLIAFIPENEDYGYYVIPSSAFENIQGEDFRIRIPHPPMSNKPSKWHKFYKRIDLIKTDLIGRENG